MSELNFNEHKKNLNYTMQQKIIFLKQPLICPSLNELEE